MRVMNIKYCGKTDVRCLKCKDEKRQEEYFRTTLR